MSLNASILLIVVMLMRLLWIKRLPKVTFLILWGLVAVKLVMPYSFYSHLNVQTLLPIESAVIVQNSSSTTTTLYNEVIHSEELLWIWGIGTVVVSLFFIISYVRFYKDFQAVIPIKNHPYFTEWLRQSKLRRTIRIAVSDCVTSPFTYKLFKPVIVLPKSMDWSDEKNLQFVLTHEYVHIKRWDVLWKILFAMIVALHWFNPLVWVMYFMVNRDIELSCDEKVIKLVGAEAKAAYALSLISMAERSHRIMPAYNSFSNNGMEERIVSIMKFKKTSMFGLALAGALVIGGITVFASTGSEAPEAPNDNISQLVESETANSGQAEMNSNGEKSTNASSETIVEMKEGNYVISREENNITIKDAPQEAESTDYTRLIEDKEYRK